LSIEPALIVGVRAELGDRVIDIRNADTKNFGRQFGRRLDRSQAENPSCSPKRARPGIPLPSLGDRLAGYSRWDCGRASGYGVHQHGYYLFSLSPARDLFQEGAPVSVSCHLRFDRSASGRRAECKQKGAAMGAFSF